MSEEIKFMEETERWAKEIRLKALVGLSILGAIMVSLGDPLMANILWSVSNPLIAMHNYGIRQNEQAALFVVFTIIAWLGVINLSITILK